MVLLISFVLMSLPLAGIAFMVSSGTIETVGGLFMGLILLTMAGIFGLNVILEARRRGLVRARRKAALPTPAATQKASS